MLLNRIHRSITLLIVLILWVCPFLLFAQSDSVVYTSDFKFEDGIYKTFEEFKQNRPSLKVKALVTDKLDAKLTLGLNHESLYYMDSLGNPITLKSNEVWGYCLNGIVYVEVQHRYHRLFKIGAIILFSEEPTSDQFSGLVPAGASFLAGDYINTSLKLDTEARHYMINFHSGYLYYYNLAAFEVLLERDKELYTEFMGIKKTKERKKQMFIYLRKFNERNHIYFKL